MAMEEGRQSSLRTFASLYGLCPSIEWQAVFAFINFLILLSNKTLIYQGVNSVYSIINLVRYFVRYLCITEILSVPFHFTECPFCKVKCVIMDKKFSFLP